MDTLISLGTLSALLYSLWALSAGGQHLYFETGAVIAALILLGRYFEARSRGQASAAIEKLMDLGAKSARISCATAASEEIPIESRAGRRCAAGETRARRSRSTARSSTGAPASMRRC